MESGAQIGGKGLIAFRGRVRTNTTEDYRMGDAGSGLMLFCCWAGILNAGPAVEPHCVVVLCLPAICSRYF